MLELVSIILGFVSVVQNMKNKKTADEKLKAIGESLDMVDVLYKLLRDAKQIHDSFEMFSRVAMDPLHGLVRQDNILPNNTFNHIESFFEYYRMMIDMPATMASISADQTKLKDLPVEIRTCVEKLAIVYPELRKAISTFEENKASLWDLHKKKNYGDDLHACVVLLNNSVKETESHADKTILHVAPVIDFIHYTLRNGVKEL